MKKPTPAFYLFHQYQSWLIPEYAIYSDYDIETYGLCLHPEPRKAAAILSNPIAVMKRPFEVASYLAQTGGYLAINNPDIAIEVYDNIMKHLANWLDYLERPSIIEREVPMVGLREFNMLANRLFPVANAHGYFQGAKFSTSDMLQAIFTGKRVNPQEQQHRFNDTIMRRIENAYRRRMSR